MELELKEGIDKENLNLEESINKWATGKIALKEITDYTDEDLETISQIGYLFLMQGKNDRALAIYNGLIVLDPDNSYYYRALGVIYYRMKVAEESIKNFGVAIEKESSDPHGYLNRAEVYISIDDFEKGEIDLKLCLERTTHRDQLLSKKAWILLKMVSEKLNKKPIKP